MPPASIRPSATRSSVAAAVTGNEEVEKLAKVGYNPTFGTTSKKENDGFTWSYTDEPHASRRKLILAKHPEITTLFGPEPLTFVVVLFEVLVQLFVANYVIDWGWPAIFLISYTLGGTINHSLQLASHELSHNLCWQSPTANKFTAMLANIPTGLPSCITFQRYHMDHHQYQGVDGVDTDIPCEFEVQFVTNAVRKILWLIAQPLAYAIRPMFIKPKPMGKWEVINWFIQLSFDLAFVYTFGLKPFAYLILSTFLGIGLHPTAGHFIAEHYEFIKGQETYSYYGPCNWVNFNVGYHNEHHDFPRVPWTRLPLVKKMAPEFYDNLPCYTSYIKVLWNFITDQEIGCYSRIKRTIPQDKRDRLDKTTDQSASKPFRALCIVTMSSTLLTMIYSAVF